MFKILTNKASYTCNNFRVILPAIDTAHTTACVVIVRWYLLLLLLVLQITVLTWSIYILVTRLLQSAATL